MDFKDINNKQNLQQEISKLTADYNKMLIDLTNGNPNEYHKAAVLFYWLQEYKNLLKREPTFNPTYLKSYSRGDIIQVNFGFNLGAEYGGKHYAVVIEDNDRSSGVITVIPLRSFKQKDAAGLHRYELSLGNELYNQFNSKISQETTKLQNQTNKIQNLINDLTSSKQSIDEILNSISQPNSELEQILTNPSKNLSQSIISLEAELKSGLAQIDVLKNCKAQFSKMKNGSIALIKQITTISKMRIVNPIKDSDALAGIKLSYRNLNAIDEKLKEFYVYK